MRRTCFTLLILLSAALGGCLHPHAGPHHDGTVMTMPPPGSVPVELAKVTLPPYVIEPPDQLSIEVITILEVPDTDPTTGKQLDPKVMVFKAHSLPVQPISGQFTVRPDGKVFLGMWGAVNVAGLTLEQAREAVRDHIASQTDPTKPNAGNLKKEPIRVLIDVLQYNSKRYYVVTDGGGAGEQVYGFPVTGSETVLDAITNIGGLPAVASKRNIWIARRTPHAGQAEQILPVDWVGLTQHGVTCSNYQIMPGDRVYVKAQKLVTIDTTLARIISPIDRLLGVTLLGSSTVNQIQGRGTGFNGN